MVKPNNASKALFLIQLGLLQGHGHAKGLNQDNIYNTIYSKQLK